jgi:hypothetical protein
MIENVRRLDSFSRFLKVRSSRSVFIFLRRHGLSARPVAVGMPSRIALERSRGRYVD